jgi:hypothetical protein
MSSFELQFDKVQELKKSVSKLRIMYSSMQQELEIEKKKLQNICQHKFIKESDGDYHKPGYYYTCKKCDYFTMYNQKCDIDI